MRGGARLGEESLARGEIGLDAGDELDGHVTREHCILREEDHAHRPAAELLKYDVVVKLGGRLERFGHQRDDIIWRLSTRGDGETGKLARCVA